MSHTRATKKVGRCARRDHIDKVNIEYDKTYNVIDGIMPTLDNLLRQTLPAGQDMRRQICAILSDYTQDTVTPAMSVETIVSLMQDSVKFGFGPLIKKGSLLACKAYTFRLEAVLYAVKAVAGKYGSFTAGPSWVAGGGAVGGGAAGGGAAGGGAVGGGAVGGGAVGGGVAVPWAQQVPLRRTVYNPMYMPEFVSMHSPVYGPIHVPGFPSMPQQKQPQVPTVMPEAVSTKMAQQMPDYATMSLSTRMQSHAQAIDRRCDEIDDFYDAQRSELAIVHSHACRDLDRADGFFAAAVLSTNGVAHQSTQQKLRDLLLVHTRAMSSIDEAQICAKKIARNETGMFGDLHGVHTFFP